MTNKNITIPEVGKEYHFFDDGKTSPSRHYICRCERIITPDESKNITFKFDDDYEKTLYDIWSDEMKTCYWLFAEKTDYFVEISCPNYDKNNLWAVRTKDGGWFTLDIQSWWQGGEVDVTGEKFNEVLEFWKNENNKDIVQAYLNCKYQ